MRRRKQIFFVRETSKIFYRTEHQNATFLVWIWPLGDQLKDFDMKLFKWGKKWQIFQSELFKMASLLFWVHQPYGHIIDQIQRFIHRFEAFFTVNLNFSTSWLKISSFLIKILEINVSWSKIVSYLPRSRNRRLLQNHICF